MFGIHIFPHKFRVQVNAAGDSYSCHCWARCVNFLEIKNCGQPKKGGCHENGLILMGLILKDESAKRRLGIRISLDNNDPK